MTRICRCVLTRKIFQGWCSFRPIEQPSEIPFSFVHEFLREGGTRREILVTAICKIIRDDDNGGSSAGRLPVCHEETGLSPITTTRSRERIVAESLSLFVLICSPELRLAHFFIRSREEKEWTVWFSQREKSRQRTEKKNLDENVNFFSRGPFYCLRSEGKGNIFLITRW